MNKFVVNDEIISENVRVLSEDGDQLGVMNTKEALLLASNQDKDLVLINESANPPVVKIIELSKHKYQLQKLEKERVKKSKENMVIVKEVQLRPVTDTHDIQIKAKQTKNFFNDGNKVKVSIRFKGRELSHQKMGEEVLEKFLSEIDDLYTVDSPASLNGSRLSITLTAKK